MLTVALSRNFPIVFRDLSMNELAEVYNVCFPQNKKIVI